MRVLLQGCRVFAAVRSAAAGGREGDNRWGLLPADVAGHREGGGGGRPPLRPQRPWRCMIYNFI